jgi:ribonuclease T1
VNPSKKVVPLLIALGAVLLLVGLGAGVWLLGRLGDTTTVAEVSTEQQLLSSTTEAPVPTTRAGAASTTTRATGATTTARGAPAATTTTRSGQATTRPAKDEHGLTIVAPARLPAEARQTLALIAKGGPYPYDRDGIVFQNREGILPKKSSGYYREYTVITPGERDRGARRIVAGSNGERYYTADHYESFVRVEEPK